MYKYIFLAAKVYSYISDDLFLEGALFDTQ